MERPIKELTEDEVKEYRVIKAALDAGAYVSKAKEGEGGIYLRGRKLSTEEVMDCVFNPDFKQTITNADRIRSMTDEELAEMLNHAQGDGFLVGIGQRKMSVYGNWLEWLKKECE